LRRNTRATRRNIPEDAILHSHSRENLKSFYHIVELVPGAHGVHPPGRRNVHSDYCEEVIKWSIDIATYRQT
jgi:hypothetical protein